MSSIDLDIYKDSSLTNELKIFFLENYDKLDTKENKSIPNEMLIQLDKLLFFVRMSSSQINPQYKENIIDQFPKSNSVSLMEQFITSLAKLLSEDSSQRNIIFASLVISLILNDKQFYSQSILLDIVRFILSNLSTLTKEQIDRINFDFILKIIRYNYEDESKQESIQNFLSIEFILNSFPSFSKSFFTRYGLQLLKLFNTFCSYQHSKKDGRLIFEKITKIRNEININYHFKYICNIIINMIKFQTLPSDLFIEYEYQNFLHDIILDKKNSSVIEYALYLIGLCTLNNIISGFFDASFFVKVFTQNYTDHIRIMILWNLSIGLNDEICHFLVETNFLNYISNIYRSCSFKLKHEIASLIANMMCSSSDPPEVFLTEQIIEILLDSMMIFDEDDVFKIGFSLYQTIEDLQCQEEGEKIEFVKKLMIDSNFQEIIDHLEENCNELNNQLAKNFNEFLDVDESNK